MKVFIDITNSPHVLFFRPIIRELESLGHEVKICAREHSQTVELLKLFHLNFKIIGKHAGRSKFNKGIEFLKRTFGLYKLLKAEKPDAVLSHQSPYVIFAAFLAGIKKRIYIFDNETARLQNLIAIPFSTRVICPEAIPFKKMYGKILLKYKGLKEGIYLKGFKPKKSVLKDLGLKKGEKFAVLRTEPSTAAYYRGGFDFPKLVGFLVKEGYRVVIIPRDSEEREIMKKRFKNKRGIIIAEKAIDGPSLIYFADLIISGGGTMNREACVLGKRVISTYLGELLAVDRFLMEKGVLMHARNMHELKEKIKMENKKAGNSFFPNLNHLMKLIFD
jgi:predicted glycosyltransferase